jgi:hypothetical protein
MRREEAPPAMPRPAPRSGPGRLLAAEVWRRGAASSTASSGLLRRLAALVAERIARAGALAVAAVLLLTAAPSSAQTTTYRGLDGAATEDGPRPAATAPRASTTRRDGAQAAPNGLRTDRRGSTTATATPPPRSSARRPAPRGVHPRRRRFGAQRRSGSIEGGMRHPRRAVVRSTGGRRPPRFLLARSGRRLLEVNVGGGFGRRRHQARSAHPAGRVFLRAPRLRRGPDDRESES